jgi:hypothetical protein
LASIEFDKDKHRYSKGDLVYKSVSKFIEEYSKPFPKDIVAKKVADRDGLDVEDVISKWDLNAEISIELGNSIHHGIEYWIDYGEIPKQHHVSDVVNDFIDKVGCDREDLKSEIVVHNDDKLLAGTIDIIQNHGDNVLSIKDIKTNYELSEDTKGYFLKPYDDVPYSKLNRYIFQLSLYKWMLEQEGFEVKDMEIYHWNGEEFDIKGIDPIEIRW